MHIKGLVGASVVSTDDGILDEPVAGLGDFLLLFFALQELAPAADGDGTCEAVGELDSIELVFNRLAQDDLVEVAQNELGLVLLGVPSSTLYHYLHADGALKKLGVELLQT